MPREVVGLAPIGGQEADLEDGLLPPDLETVQEVGLGRLAEGRREVDLDRIEGREVERLEDGGRGRDPADAAAGPKVKNEVETPDRIIPGLEVVTGKMHQEVKIGRETPGQDLEPMIKS